MRRRPRKEPMLHRSFYLPEALINEVAKYAELRAVSRNVAVEELLRLALHGDVKRPNETCSPQDAIKRLRSE